MFSSMVATAFRGKCRAPRHPRRGRTVARRTTLVALVAASLVATGPSTMAAAAGAPARRCTTAAAPAPIIADVPWPQHRYDLTALSQINDGAGVTVAVLDSGVDASHPQLAGAVVVGFDMLDSKGDARIDCVGHGTAVASIIAARPVTGSGLRGLAPAVRILPILVSERTETEGVVTGDGNVAELAAGITAAVNARPKPAVINLSIATSADNPALRAAVKAALDADIVVVAAAGNQHERGDPKPYPASYEGVIGVGAIGPDGIRLAMSQVGSYVDIVAPGDQIVAASPGNGHASVQGTSFAVPFVSATAALIRARWPGTNRIEVERRLLATADPAAGARAGYGYGVLNPVRALSEVLPPAGVAGASRPATASLGAPALAPATAPGRDRALAVAAILLLVAAAVSGIAAAVPIGRRRNWRPGRVSEP
jgi:type VII secretion-associated serine protease mycosin